MVSSSTYFLIAFLSGPFLTGKGFELSLPLEEDTPASDTFDKWPDFIETDE